MRLEIIREDVGIDAASQIPASRSRAGSALEPNRTGANLRPRRSGRAPGFGVRWVGSFAFLRLGGQPGSCDGGSGTDGHGAGQRSIDRDYGNRLQRDEGSKRPEKCGGENRSRSASKSPKKRRSRNSRGLFRLNRNQRNAAYGRGGELRMAHAHPGLDGSDPEIPHCDLRRSGTIAQITREAPIRWIPGAGLFGWPITSRTVRAQGTGGGAAE